MDQLPRLGKRELICLLLFTCNYVVFVWRGFLFLWVLGMGYVILLWHSLSLPYNYFADSSQSMKSFSSVGELSSKLNSDNFCANFEELRLFSILYDICDINKWAFFFFFNQVF